jgi:hypothetical protein
MNKIWSKNYEVGDFWVRTDLSLLSADAFQVVLEAVVGKGYAGDIAIDDTSFTPGCVLANIDLVTVTTPIPTTTAPNPCAATNQFACMENGQCIDKNKVCDFNVDCPTPGGSDEANCAACTFDNNNGTLCGWKSYSFGTFDWKLTAGPINLGPTGDHTTGSGFYVSLPATQSYVFSSLRTGAIGPTGIECQLKFWYYMDSNPASFVSNIAVYLRREANNFTSFTFVARIDQSTGAQWKQAVVDIGGRSERIAIGRYIDLYLNKNKQILQYILSFQKLMDHLNDKLL